MATHCSILAWRILTDRGAWRATVHGVAESDTTETLCRSTINNNTLGKGGISSQPLMWLGDRILPQTGISRTPTTSTL